MLQVGAGRFLPLNDSVHPKSGVSFQLCLFREEMRRPQGTYLDTHHATVKGRVLCASFLNFLQPQGTASSSGVYKALAHQRNNYVDFLGV